MNISFDREARGRQEPAQRCDIVAIEANAGAEHQPARDATFALALAIVIDETAAPFPPRRGILAARDQARVLERDHRLVIIAIKRPGLHLALAALAAVQKRMKRMQPVITPRADVAQRRLELFGCQKF